ncbi:MAG: S8 family serine peptidase, partial [Methanobacteriota archaeon]
MRVAAVAVILFLAAAVPVNLLPSTFYTDAAWWHALDLDGDRWDDGLQVSGLRQSVLVEFPRIPTARDVSDLEAAGFDVALAFHRFPRVHASIDRPPASYELPADVLFVERDRPVFPALDVAAVAIRARGAASAGGGAPAPQSVWEGLGVTGAGVIVAVLDTGVHDRHSAFGDALVAEFDCSKACAADIALDLDPNGHGTHVAGTLLSRDAVFRGIAPAARLVDVKVASEVGVAVELAFLSGIQRGLQQVLDYNEGKAPEEQIRVVNVSFGSQPGGSGDDSTTEAVDAVVATGVVVVVAAGNCGPAGNPAECAGRQGDRDTITSPGTAADAITVAALDDRNTPARSDDTVADYSSRGTNGGAPKPDVAAPGTNIRSPTNIPAGDGFGDISGTSFSAPAVAG